jgi:hypothetical protein
MKSLRQYIWFLTAPGVVFHEMGHQLFCYLTKVKVVKVCYFRFGNPAGYVIHAQPKNFFQSFFIVVGPFISGTFLALLCFYLAENAVGENWHRILLIWLGISVGYNSFPSDADAKNLWRDSNRHIFSNLLAVIGYSFAIIIWLANAFSVILIELIYTLFLYYLINPLW